MLAELAIANAAFKVIKTTLSNGKEIADAGAALGKYFNAEKKINKQVKDGTGNVMEAFQAQEKLKKNEVDLKFMLNKQRLHGYVDFCKFRENYNKGLRVQASRQKKANAKQSKSNDTTMAIILSISLLLIIFVFGGLLWVARIKGMI
jgi:uncharacterized protein YneF (UPF0154 family)|tara:strand:- start:60 stop:500 length:441 start_codon:yes stop_codon:yes gene_type:complete